MYYGLTPDQITGYTIIGAFPVVNHDLVTVGLNKVDDTHYNVSVYNAHTGAQDVTVTVVYVYMIN